MTTVRFELLKFIFSPCQNNFKQFIFNDIKENFAILKSPVLTAYEACQKFFCTLQYL